jgi:hypothetical protein
VSRFRGAPRKGRVDFWQLFARTTDTVVMKRKMQSIWVLPLAVLGGCVDLGLLDELIPYDAGEDGEGEASDADADSDTDGDGPPPTDATDHAAPAIVPTACGEAEIEADGLCIAAGNGTAAVRLSTDEPAVIEATAPAGARVEVASDPWAIEHLVVAVDLPVSAEVALGLSLADVNGNGAEREATVCALEGPTVSVTEVLADPLGPEPAQEFVEIANYGDVEVDLSGWMIDDGGDSDGDVLPAGALLPPGKAAILAADDYDPDSAGDPAPPGDAIIIRVGSSIGTGGLKNSDVETVELYDALGVLVSAYDGRVGDPVEGRSAARVRAEAPDGCPRAFVETPIPTPTPGTAPFIP